MRLEDGTVCRRAGCESCEQLFTISFALCWLFLGPLSLWWLYLYCQLIFGILCLFTKISVEKKLYLMQMNIWNYSSRKLLHSIETGHTANIFCTKFVPETSDELVVSGAGDAEVVYWYTKPLCVFITMLFTCLEWVFQKLMLSLYLLYMAGSSFSFVSSKGKRCWRQCFDSIRSISVSYQEG